MTVDYAWPVIGGLAAWVHALLPAAGLRLLTWLHDSPTVAASSEPCPISAPRPTVPTPAPIPALGL